MIIQLVSDQLAFHDTLNHHVDISLLQNCRTVFPLSCIVMAQLCLTNNRFPNEVSLDVPELTINPDNSDEDEDVVID